MAHRRLTQWQRTVSEAPAVVAIAMLRHCAAAEGAEERRDGAAKRCRAQRRQHARWDERVSGVPRLKFATLQGSFVSG
eukprot:scaffold51729_cov54-Phaeocystis_antarctica.AAC.5